MGQIFDKGDPLPKRKLTFHIEVTDEGTTHFGFAALRRSFKNWRRIGTLSFDNAVASQRRLYPSFPPPGLAQRQKQSRNGKPAAA
jgi:hypothetical protein